MARGRPPILTELDIPRVESALIEAGSIEEAAKRLGYNAKLIHRFKNRHNLRIVKRFRHIAKDGAA